LKLPIEYLHQPFMAVDNFLYIPNSEKIMVIDKIKEELEEDGKVSVLVSGESAESLLRRRVIEEAFDWDGPVELILYSTFVDNISDPTDPNRRIDLFDQETPALLMDHLHMDQFDITTVYDFIFKVGSEMGLGVKVFCEDINAATPKLYFLVYEGTNRSTDQTDVPWVIFSQVYGNLLSSSYYNSTEDQVSVVYMVTTESEEDISEELSKMYVWDVNYNEPTGLHRHETVEALDVDRDKTGTRLLDYELLGLINNRGREVIAEYSPVDVAEADVYIAGEFRYGVHFFMGDIIQVNTPNREDKARIIELVRSYTPEGNKTYVALDFEGVT